MSGYKSKQAVNQFVKGMNLDIDNSLMSNESYRYAENFRLVTNKNNSTGTLENVDGTELTKEFTEITGTNKIIAYNIIRNYLTLFTASSDDTTSLGGIYVYNLDSNISYLKSFKDTENNIILGFRYSDTVKSVGRYESPTIIKVYFVDGRNTCKYINLALSSYAFEAMTSDDMDFIPNATLTPPIYNNITEGKLKAGRIQYAYQLFDSNGVETTISVPSNLINLTKSDPVTGTDSLSINYTGSALNEDTNKGVIMTIPNSDSISKFANIRVYSIHYSQINQLPTINLIIEQPIIRLGNGDFVFTDYGTTILDELTLEEFNILSSIEIIAKDIETKNNILFLANTKEKRWDIDLSTYDTRSFRFRKSTATTKPSTTSLKGIPNTTRTFAQAIRLSLTHDAINPYNTINKNTAGKKVTADDCAFNINDKLGGSGANIDFEFTTIPIYDTTLNNNAKSQNIRLYNNGTSYKGFEDIYNSSTIVGLQRDEVYRFGIVFYNQKGQVSPANWIADIRTPNILDTDELPGAKFLYSGYYDGGTNAIDPYYYIYSTLGIKFTIKNLDLLKQLGVVAFEIVRVKRTGSDRSVISQGVMTYAIQEKWDRTWQESLATPFFPTMKHRTDRSDTPIPTTQRVALFTSPETVYNNNLDKQNIQFVERIGIFDDYSLLDCSRDSTLGNLEWDLNKQLYTVSVGDYDQSEPNGTYLDNSFTDDRLFLMKGNTLSTVNTNFTEKANINTIDIKLLSYEYFNSTDYAENRNNLKVYSFSNSKVYRNLISHSIWYRDSDGSDDWNAKPYGFAGTKLAFTISETFMNNSNDNKVPLSLCNLRKTNGGQYGGNTYTARQLNEYISCGSYYIIGNNTSLTFDTFGGDTYVSTYEALWAMSDQTNNYTDSSQVILFIPCESSINLKYTSGATWHNKKSIDTKTNAGRLHEKAGVYGGPDKGYVVQETDYYIYNTIYSQENTAKTFVTEKYFENKNDTFDTRVHYSDTKVSSELIDSWTKFRALNYIDVDSQYGPINNILTFKNQLYFWQDNAFGWLAVRERELLSASNATNLVLGTGGILDRYDYISMINGCINNNAICKSDNAIYWFDGLNKEICGFSGQGVSKLSKTKGVQSWLNYMNTFTKTDILNITYDQIFNEVSFSLRQQFQDKVLIYSEIIEAFTGFYTYTPDLYVNNNNNLYSIKNNKLYKHNKNNKGVFYDVKYPSRIKILVNDQYKYTKVFDNIEYLATSITNDSNNIYKYTMYNNLDDTFNTIQCYNDYQNTGEIALIYKQNYNRKERSYILPIPRNIVNKNIDNNIFNTDNLTTGLLFKERLMDKYLYIDLKYNNTDGNVLNLPYLITNYRVSIR